MSDREIHKRASIASLRVYHLVVTALGFLLLIFALIYFPWGGVSLWTFAAIVLFLAFEYLFPLKLFSTRLSLAHATTLGASFILGPTNVALAATLGSLMAIILERLNFAGDSDVQLTDSQAWSELFFQLGSHHTALFASFFLAGGGMGALTPWLGRSELPGVLRSPLILFPVVHMAIFAGGFLLRRSSGQVSEQMNMRRDLGNLILLEVLPLPFVLIAIIGYPATGTGTLILLGGIPSIFAVLLHGIGLSQADLIRRLHELNTIQQVSRSITTTLDIESVFEDIHARVSLLLGVENFYIALYDQDQQIISYPLAVKHHERAYWPARPPADRLTDRVIREGKPVMISDRGSEELVRMGLVAGDQAPESWMGVPLITPRRTVGCLAVSSFAPRVKFTQADLDVFITLAGQVSVAVENALLYEQARRRAAQLETLNRITGLVTASLNLEEVLDQICRSAAQVAGSEQSAIYLLDLEAGDVSLVYAFGLSDGFLRRNQKFPIDAGLRGRSLRTGQPVLVGDVREVSSHGEFVALVRDEGIQAYGDFPLATADGRIGYLSVYFPTLHDFSGEETEILQTFAYQASLAVANARLYVRTDAALSRRVQQLSILESVGRELAAAIRSERLFEMVLNYSFDYTGSSCGYIGIWDAPNRRGEIKAWRGYPAPLPDDALYSGISGGSIQTRETVYVADVHLEPEQEAYVGDDTRARVSVPLIYKGRVLGALTLESNRQDGYSQEDRAFLTQLAQQAAVAVVNAELYAQANRERNRLTSVLNSVGEGILMIDSRGEVLLANRELRNYSGYDLPVGQGETLDELPLPVLRLFDLDESKARGIVQVLDSGGLLELPHARLLIGEDVQQRHLERYTYPVQNDEGKAIGWVLVVRDVSDEVRLRQERELITETLVHDLRSPVSAVLGSLDFLEEALRDKSEEVDEPTMQAIQIARRSASRILGMVENLLDIAGLKSGLMELSLERLDIKRIVASVFKDFNTQIRDYGIVVHNDIPADLPPVCGDLNRIRRVFANLVDNALKFTPGGGQVRISAERLSDETLMVRVQDSGSGVPEAYLERIFDRFGQVPGQKGRRRGTGLGLAFCRMAVEAHGGRIWVETPPEGGSAFVFTLPLVDY